MEGPLVVWLKVPDVEEPVVQRQHSLAGPSGRAAPVDGRLEVPAKVGVAELPRVPESLVRPPPVAMHVARIHPWSSFQQGAVNEG